MGGTKIRGEVLWGEIRALQPFGKLLEGGRTLELLGELLAGGRAGKLLIFWMAIGVGRAGEIGTAEG